MISGVHLVATISAAAATAQLASCTSFIVRFMMVSLVRLPAASYRKESDLLNRRIAPVEPVRTA